MLEVLVHCEGEFGRANFASSKGRPKRAMHDRSQVEWRDPVDEEPSVIDCRWFHSHSYSTLEVGA